MSSIKKINVVGAGPGGLTAAMLLAKRGFKVTLFEKEKSVGGRNAAIVKNGYKFDVGPTFLMMKFILDEVFEEAGRNVDDYMEFTKLEPMYRLQFDDVRLEPTTVKEAMIQQLDTNFPGSSKGYEKFLKTESVRFEKMYPCLQKDYSSFKRFLSLDLLKALPKLSLGKSLIGVLGNYFKSEKLKLSFKFLLSFI